MKDATRDSLLKSERYEHLKMTIRLKWWILWAHLSESHLNITIQMWKYQKPFHLFIIDAKIMRVEWFRWTPDADNEFDAQISEIGWHIWIVCIVQRPNLVDDIKCK